MSLRPFLFFILFQVSAMLAKACALVLEDYPVVNARYEPGKTVYQKDINVAMAVAIDGGLITPTLKVTASPGSFPIPHRSVAVIFVTSTVL